MTTKILANGIHSKIKMLRCLRAVSTNLCHFLGCQFCHEIIIDLEYGDSVDRRCIIIDYCKCGNV